MSLIQRSWPDEKVTLTVVGAPVASGAGNGVYVLDPPDIQQPVFLPPVDLLPGDVIEWDAGRQSIREITRDGLIIWPDP